MITQYFYPALIGGAEWYIYNISRELKRLGHDVTVFTLDRYRGKKLLGSLNSLGVTIHRISPLLDLSYRVKFWPKLIKKILQSNTDVFHCFDYLLFHSITAALLRNRIQPICTTVFDVHHLIPRNPLKSHLIQGLDFSFGRYALNHIDRVLLRSPTLVKALQRMGIDPNKIVITPSGVRSDELNLGNPKLFRNEFEIFGPIVLYLGRLHPMKGPQFLLKAAQIVLNEKPDIKFVFIGPDHGAYRSKLEKIRTQLNLEKNVLFTGPIYNILRKVSAIASCDVFVMPSGYEGTSQAIFLAMAQKKPVIATNAGGIPFQIRHGKEGFLCNYGDFRTIAHNILHLLNNEDLMMKLGHAGRKRVLSNFTYPILAKKLENIYKAMITT